MVTSNKSDGGTPSTGKWLLMFYVAGDNNLSALFVDQLKAIKDAGFAQNVEVIVRFDPHEPDIKTRTFNVNHKRKQAHGPGAIQSGDGNDPFVRNMIEDLMVPESDEPKADQALDRFIRFCLRKYDNAEHHMLFLVGHGLVVGNDAFLPDEFPQSGITLKRFGEIIRENFGKKKSLELLGLHACAMSAIEVLYELQGSAKYMLASEGLSFVNGWPYRQLLKRFFNGVGKEYVEALIESFYWLTFYNAKDFLLAGFPLELSLLNLDPARIRPLTEKIQGLVQALKNALADEHGRDAIQLAHLKSQSYFNELYTDLFDFCFCLKRQCKDNEDLNELSEACQQVINELMPESGNEEEKVLERFKKLVIHSNHFGSRSQYSHGLSILFPWVNPRKNAKQDEQVMAMYEHYNFTESMEKPDRWFDFLLAYFKTTMRDSREVEDGRANLDDAPGQFRITEDDAMNWTEALDNTLEKPTGAVEKPTGGTDSSTCDCPQIKNFPKTKDPYIVIL